MRPSEMHDARFSNGRRYRYWLEAKVSDRDGVCLFIMLNPSTADEVKSDPTVTRCKGFAERWGYGALWVCNLFAIRSPNPEILEESSDPVGPMNDHHILKHARDANRIVCAWGNHGLYLSRGKTVLRMLDDNDLTAKTYHLGLTGENQPKHPLYLDANTRPVRFQGKLHRRVV